MAEKETKNKPKDLIEPVPEEIAKLEKEIEKSGTESSVTTPKHETRFRGREKDFDKVPASGRKVLEPEIIDSLVRLESDLLHVGQAKGKFGGGKRRAWRQTQKKTMEGNVVTFSAMAVVGDKKGHVGVGYGKSKETLPARAKAVRQAKLNIIKIIRGFESIESGNTEI